MYVPFSEFQIPKGVTSVIGSGGKSSFLKYFAEKLNGSVILTPSTHMLPFPGIPLVKADSEADSHLILGELRSAISRSKIACLGAPHPSGALFAPCGITFRELEELADYVLIEADGSKNKPLKAHRPFEPIIPPCSKLTVCLIGASGIGKLPSEACHCPDLFLSLSGGDPEEAVRADQVARVINKEKLADCCFVNQVDILPDPRAAVQLCELIHVRAFAGALRQGLFLETQEKR
jgi:probable selenium-dependent hydroxylase accessory protein YqeC